MRGITRGRGYLRRGSLSRTLPFWDRIVWVCVWVVCCSCKGQVQVSAAELVAKPMDIQLPPELRHELDLDQVRGQGLGAPFDLAADFGSASDADRRTLTTADADGVDAAAPQSTDSRGPSPRPAAEANPPKPPERHREPRLPIWFADARTPEYIGIEALGGDGATLLSFDRQYLAHWRNPHQVPTCLPTCPQK